MSTSNVRILTGLSLTTCALLACGSSTSTQRAPVAGTTEAQPGVTSSQAADQDIVEQIARARCDREQSCNNIGAGAKYASQANCMEKLRGSIGNDLNGYNCPGGLDRGAIDRCTRAIQNEECNHPFDTLSREDKCRASSICIK